MAYLVSVTGSRLPLRRGHRYVVGRGRDCDIVVNDAMASRHHACLEVMDGVDRVALDDMDSRNGTFVNGQKILGPTDLPDGGRLRVGRTVFVLQLAAEPPVEQLEETCTSSFNPDTEDPAGPDGGELAALGALVTLKLVVNARRSVTMHVALPTAAARIEFRNGEIVSARHGGLNGFSALVRIARAESGIFWLVEATGPCDERNIHQPAAQVLFELTRCVDQLARLNA